MRLGALGLILASGLALAAQGRLPWETASVPPWKTAQAGADPPAYAPLDPRGQTALLVHLSGDGTLRITDERGLVRLRMGLPGRPVSLWRDGGLPLSLAASPFGFHRTSPSPGKVGGDDFRWALEGLLWILDDGEKVITVVNPATLQVVYLPLPGGRGVRLAFFPDRLEAQEIPSEGGTRRDRASWSLPWASLLPQFIQLRNEGLQHRNLGTALVPFPGG